MSGSPVELQAADVVSSSIPTEIVEGIDNTKIECKKGQVQKSSPKVTSSPVIVKQPDNESANGQKVVDLSEIIDEAITTQNAINESSHAPSFGKC